MRNIRLKIFLVLLMLLSPTVNRAQVSCVNYPRDHYIEVNFRLPDYTIIDTIPDSIYDNSNTFSYITVDNRDFGIIDSVGCPELPQLTINLNIPINAYGIKFKVLSYDSETIMLHHPYYANQYDVPKDDTIDVWKYRMNMYVYDTLYEYPDKLADTAETFIVRDRKGVGFCIMPFSYSGRYREMRVFRSMRIRVDYQVDSAVVETVDSTGLWEDYYEDLFDNYTAQYTGGAGTSGRYLMVVHESLSQAIGSFMAYKRNIGYAVDTITIRSDDATPSGIKARIQQRYDNQSTRPDFVLLVGDHELLPAYCGDSTMNEKNNPITDLPYSCLKGNDLLPEVWMGRWPVINENEVKYISNKTIFMEMNMHTFSKRALFISGDQNPDDCSIKRNYMLNMFKAANDDIREDAFIPYGYGSDALYQPNEQQTINAFERDPRFFIYSGHGSVQSVGPIKYTTTDTFRINNTFFENIEKEVFPMAFVFACKTGNYAANNKCVGETIIRDTNGFVSYLGASVNSMTNSDNVLERKMLGESLWEYENTYLGKVIEKGKSKFRGYIGISKEKRWRYSKAYNLMGDPSFLVFGRGCGHDYWIENTNLIDGDNQVYHASNYVNISSCTVGSGARLAVTSGDEIIIEDGFEAMFGSDVTLSIEQCINPVTTKTPILPYETDSSEKLETIEDSLSEEKVKVYPSPVHDILNIEYYSESNKKTWIKVYDVYGREVMSRERINTVVGMNKEQVDLSIHPNGCYCIVVMNGAESPKTVCIIKQ